VLLLLDVAGCAATRGRRGEPEKSGFLGDYSQLAKVEGFPAALIYLAPDVDWSRYRAVQLDSVGLWATEGTEDMSEEDKQMLTDTLFAKLHQALDETFVLASGPGPGTLRLRAALTQAEGANVAMRTVTTVIPQARLLGGMMGVGADTATMVGSATVEVEILDSTTNRRLAAAVDARAGTKVLFAKRAYNTWGDVETACERWAKRIAWQLARHGVQRKPGAPMPEEPSEERTF
jgi:hypothetical protein